VSTGLNLAIRAADSDIIIRMDAHSEYAPDYIAQSVRYLDATGADNVGGPARTKSDGFMNHAISTAYHSPFACGGAKFHDETYEGYVDTVVYGCWKKSTLERAGLFDENLVRNQDDELNLRLTRAGCKLWQSPSIVSWYRPRRTLPSLFRQYFQYGFWKVPVIRKHRLPASWRHLMPGAFLFGNLVLLIAGVSGVMIDDPDLSIRSLALWGMMLAVYLVVSFYFAVRAASWKDKRLIPILPIVFTVYHLAYGAGFLSGLLYWSVTPESKQSARPFTQITR
jgi:hypothetical protein